MSLASSRQGANPATRHSGGTIPQDIPTLSAAGTAGGTAFKFVTAQDSYTPLSYELPRTLLATPNETAGNDEALRDAGLTALFDIYLDQLRFARALIDLAALRASDAAPAFNPQTSPILAYLRGPNRATVTSVADIFPGGHGDFARRRSTIEKLRAFKRTALAMTTSRTGRADVIARGGLVDAYIATESHPTVDINPYLLTWPKPDFADPALHNLSNALVSVYATIIAPHIEDIPGEVARASTAVHFLTKTWFAQAIANARYIETSAVARHHGSVLVGAAPKVLGRTLARLYRAHGAQVVRCAHGGERAFYDDDHWGLSEFPFCDTYMTHGRGEAEAIARRYAEGRMIGVHPNAPTCTALGSSRHASIYRQAHENQANRKSRNGRPRVMLAASSFLGEGASHVPAIKPADIHLADLQISLMRSLRELGCDVLFKPHPKTMIQAPELFAGSFDELVTGPFDPAHHDVDAYVFDYAGSAFFDALASARGVILVDTGVRPFDLTTFDDLSARCTIVATEIDDAHRFRVESDALRDAVESATAVSQCAESFADRYFFGGGVIT